MEGKDPIITVLQRGKPAALERARRQRISEALGWGSGTKGKPRKHVVGTLADTTEVFFLKPGKEVFNEKRPNPHDMTPMVGEGGETWRFDEIWGHLSRASVVDFERFRQLLVLVYRNAYLLDHKEVRPGVVRYLPSEAVQKRIHEIDEEIGDVLPHRVMGFLHFLDVLGWNEDVKYHVEGGRPTFTGRYQFKVGRTNTLLTCIRVPYQMSDFIKDVLDNKDDPTHVDFKSVYEVMQQFAKSRGTCTPTQQKLASWLHPYFADAHQDSKKDISLGDYS